MKDMDLKAVQDEYELVHYPKIRHINIFLINIRYRNSHIHDELELLTVLHGRGTLRLKQGIVNIEKGSSVLLNSYEAHEIHGGSGGITAIVTQVSRHFCEEYFPEIKNLEFKNNSVQDYLEPDRRAGFVNRVCENALTYIKAVKNFELDILGNICFILNVLITNVPNIRMSDSAFLSRVKCIKRMNSISAYLDSHYLQKTTLKNLADHEGVSPTHLSHFFTKNFGVGFQEYMNNLRFEKAMRLISLPGTTLLQTALDSGFSDSKYMNKMFLKRLGCTPREYKKGLSLEDRETVRMKHRGLQYYYTDDESVKRIQEYLQG
ncbi:MAG: helix-turn-helix transcriptional regulator [Spirochaetales bacterium]|nr:helix-turn-helix transcriptional regulator [Spirochaetales bacterium]